MADLRGHIPHTGEVLLTRYVRSTPLGDVYLGDVCVMREKGVTVISSTTNDLASGVIGPHNYATHDNIADAMACVVFMAALCGFGRRIETAQ